MIFIFEIRFKNTNIAITNISTPYIILEENKAMLLDFSLKLNSNYFNKLNRFIDKLEVFQIDNELNERKVFEGRVLDIKKSLDTNGRFINSVTCEGYLNYLLDTTVEVWEVHPDAVPPDSPKYAEGYYDTKKFIFKILENHNKKVGEEKKIHPGIITVIEPIYCMTNRETSLSAIYEKLINRNGGFLNLREEQGKLYLDYLKDNPVTEENEISIGINLKDLNSENGIKSICTRLIGIGAKNKIISISEDKELIQKFGVIEQVIEFPDVTIQENLDRKVKEKLSSMNIDNDISSITALDLSYIDNEFKEISLSQNVNVLCEPLNYNEKHRIVKITLNLENPWNSSFTLNNLEPSQISSNNSIIQETNNNKLEIYQMNGKIIQKVSNSEFETYKEQTEKDISQKVSNGDFSTLFKQNIEGFDFTIGKNTPLSIREDSLIFKFKDGTMCTMDKEGFNWNRDGERYPYKSMVARGTVTRINTGDTVRIYVPKAFRGKDYEISWWTGNIFPEHEGDLLFSANTELIGQNKKDGWFDIKANMMVRNPNTTDKTPFQRGSLNVVWIAIA